MMVTALVLAAIGGLMTSVARGWQQSTSTQDDANSTFILHLRMERLFRTARQLGAYRVGTIEGGGGEESAILFWKGDANGDGVMNYSEVALLEHHTGATRADDQLCLYQIQFPSNMTQAAKDAWDAPDPSESTDWIYDKNGNSAIDEFKNLQYFNPTPTILARYVTGCECHVSDGSSVARPVFSYLVNLQKDGSQSTETEYGTVALRDPAALPSSQGGTP
jgi:hypothetical protein